MSCSISRAITRPLELYNDDYDEVERSYTTDGAVNDEGYLEFTNEDGWTVDALCGL